MELVFNIIKGVMIGIANVIPGVSGGTMAVSFGIYDRLISSISGFTKHVKESLALLAPILLGCALGIAGFTYAIEYLLENHTFVTCMTFVGGIVASATMVIPGVSGSMMLMILGYYYGIINTITSFLDGLRAMDLAALKDGFLLLAPFGIGVLLGIVLIARLISFLFERYGVQTYGAILGLVLASPFAIFYNTGLFGELSSLSVWAVLLGIMLMIGGAVVTNFVGEK